MIKPQTLKGFRDFLPEDAMKRQYVIDKLRKVFELYGFEPLETPALEYEEVLLGKYGTEGDKLMYRFVDNGGRRIALRYDQTVPLARVVTQYPDLPKPFKRYQIQPVWRAENPQKGRFREFLQCDADIIGTSSPLADAEVITTAVRGIQELGFKKFKVLINDRDLFEDAAKTLRECFRDNLKIQLELFFILAQAVDKLKKSGKDGVLADLEKRGLSEEQAVKSLEIVTRQKPTKCLTEIFEQLKKFGVEENQFFFENTLARGLDYYTGMIFEIEIENYAGGSICGGGRYDELIGIFNKAAGSIPQNWFSEGGGLNIPAVGFAFGFDRLVEAMDELNLFPQDTTTSNVLVTIFSPELLTKSIEMAKILRSKKINTDLYSDPNSKLDKQLKYADKKGIPYALIIGPDEVKNNRVSLKNLKDKTQQTVSQNELLAQLLKSS